MPSATADRGGPRKSGLLGIVGSAYRRSPRTVVAATALTLIGTVASVYVPLGLRQVVSSVGGPGVWPAILVLSGVALISAAANTAATLVLATVGERLVHRMRTALGSVVMRMPLARVRALGHGTLVTRSTADTAQVRAAIDLTLAQIPAAVLGLALSVAIMAWLDLVLLGVTAACFAVGGAVVGLLLRRIRRHAARQQAAIARFAQQLSEGMSALTVIRAFRAERRVIDGLDEAAGRAAGAGLSTMRLQAATTPVLELTQQIAVVSVLAVGGYRIASGAMGLPDLAAFLLYLFQLVMPMVTIGTGLGRLSAALASNDRVGEVLDEPTEPAPSPSEASSAPAPAGTDAVRISGVNFGFDGVPVLHDLHITIPERGLTAIVGPSGAGKTTLLKLIEGFERPTSGELAVFGRTPDGPDLDWVRRQLSYVDQEGPLFPGTLRENLALGRPDDVTDIELRGVLDRLGLASLVEQMPAGLDTDLAGARGLSGGQRQRIAIARAVVAEAPLMLLDEPTAHLDRQSETAVHDIVTSVRKSRAVVLVAHRMRTVLAADHIIVLDEGRQVDDGTHEELAGRCDVYRALLAEQHLVGT